MALIVRMAGGTRAGAWRRAPNAAVNGAVDKIAGIGRPWDDAPDGIATWHTPVDLNHVAICLVHCAP